MAGRNTLARKRFRQNVNLDRDEPDANREVRAQFIEACCGTLDDPPSALDRGLKTFADLAERRMLEYEDATKELLQVPLEWHIHGIRIRISCTPDGDCHTNCQADASDDCANHDRDPLRKSLLVQGNE